MIAVVISIGSLVALDIAIRKKYRAQAQRDWPTASGTIVRACVTYAGPVIEPDIGYVFPLCDTCIRAASLTASSRRVCVGPSKPLTPPPPGSGRDARNMEECHQAAGGSFSQKVMHFGRPSLGGPRRRAYNRALGASKAQGEDHDERGNDSTRVDQRGRFHRYAGRAGLHASAKAVRAGADA
jgi:hypothetical protein